MDAVGHIVIAKEFRQPPDEAVSLLIVFGLLLVSLRASWTTGGTLQCSSSAVKPVL
jgi:hypothetical protein